MKCRKQNTSNAQNNQLIINENTTKINEAKKRRFFPDSVIYIENFIIKSNSGTIIFGNNLGGNPTTGSSTNGSANNGSGTGNTGNVLNEITGPRSTNYIRSNWTKKSKKNHK